METPPIEGLHHVTCVAGDPGGNVGFYTDVLGLRLVKRTVNFDDVTTYHLYYGNGTGEPGTPLTFFPFRRSRAGTVGAGQVRTTLFHVPADSLDYWRDRFDDRDVAHESTDRFGTETLAFADHDGLQYELVAADAATTVEPWADGPVPTEHAIRGFYGVELALEDHEPTADLLELMGYDRTDETDDAYRYRGDGDQAAVVDLALAPERGRPGVGTVHHVAFRVPDDETQEAWRERLIEEGYQVTPQKDRQYFRSIYFREVGGVLFEFATEGPGFTRDEAVEDLGSSLQLPSWLEDDRETIERSLPPLDADAVDPEAR
jgi:glyoxalase family protein